MRFAAAVAVLAWTSFAGCLGDGTEGPGPSEPDTGTSVGDEGSTAGDATENQAQKGHVTDDVVASGGDGGGPYVMTFAHVADKEYELHPHEVGFSALLVPLLDAYNASVPDGEAFPFEGLQPLLEDADFVGAGLNASWTARLGVDAAFLYLAFLTPASADGADVGLVVCGSDGVDEPLCRRASVADAPSRASWLRMLALAHGPDVAFYALDVDEAWATLQRQGWLLIPAPVVGTINVSGERETRTYQLCEPGADDNGTVRGSICRPQENRSLSGPPFGPHGIRASITFTEWGLGGYWLTSGRTFDLNWVLPEDGPLNQKVEADPGAPAHVWLVRSFHTSGPSADVTMLFDGQPVWPALPAGATGGMFPWNRTDVEVSALMDGEPFGAPRHVGLSRATFMYVDVGDEDFSVSVYEEPRGPPP